MQFHTSCEFGVGIIASAHQLTHHAGLAGLNNRQGPHLARRADQGNSHAVGDVGHIDENRFSLFQAAGIFNQQLGQLIVTRIAHGRPR